MTTNLQSVLDQTVFDAFGWSPLGRSNLGPAETYGLDYDSARDATPRWFGVSFGNGNDGVSQMFPDYYCRTADPFLLAAVAVVASFKPAGKAFAVENCEVDGEADYTISATILNPPDDGEESNYQEIAESEGYRLIEHDSGEFSWQGSFHRANGIECDESRYDDESAAWKACCEECDLSGPSWSDGNGAWLICEVFPIDDMESIECMFFGTDSEWPLGIPAGLTTAPFGKPAYLSLADCFSSDDLQLAASI